MPGGAIGVDEKLELPQSVLKAESVGFWWFGQSMLRVYMHCFVRQWKFAAREELDGVPIMSEMRWFFNVLIAF